MTTSTSTYRLNGYKKTPLLLVLAVVFTAFSQNVQSQTHFKIAPGSEVKVSGTSNLHDWTMLANEFSCAGSLLMKNGALVDITSLKFVLPVINLKSNENLMDSRAHKALKAKVYPNITFVLTQASLMAKQKSINATGNLTISGVTNKVDIQAIYSLNADETVTIKGFRSVKMADYKIKAPSFMLGALKTGDELVISFVLKLKTNELQSKN